jgi:hypothetical protein
VALARWPQHGAASARAGVLELGEEAPGALDAAEDARVQQQRLVVAARLLHRPPGAPR